jgi:hypothetical protein
VNNAALNMGVQVSLCWERKYADFLAFGFTHLRGIIGSYGSSVFNFLRKLHTIFIMIILVYILTKSI